MEESRAERRVCRQSSIVEEGPGRDRGARRDLLEIGTVRPVAQEHDSPTSPGNAVYGVRAGQRLSLGLNQTPLGAEVAKDLAIEPKVVKQVAYCVLINTASHDVVFGIVMNGVLKIDPPRPSQPPAEPSQDVSFEDAPSRKTLFRTSRRNRIAVGPETRRTDLPLLASWWPVGSSPDSRGRGAGRSLPR